MADAFDLGRTYLSLDGHGGARMLPGGAAFWQALAAGQIAPDTWLISQSDSAEPWPHWEMHPDGEEVIVMLYGCGRMRLDRGEGPEATIMLSAGQAFLMPRGVWHRFEPDQPSRMLFITAGQGTQHRPV